ncbi:hypothetical protein [Telluria aromaticivorans]|uniref:Flagellar assembly protein T N-terminal domain-containing protein n=1 Tax=Telluria aromaticivorans TaxID=2725995 RepID=A0A7Y2JZS1_9BURK|nr:hypothetical protein [Telluria aromaticivorans]NNG23500.1 hypothetical protein [Telluria aromaticivorans]
MKKTLLLSALLALGSIGATGTAAAETFSANGVKELSIKASGDLVNARRIAREQAELAAVASVLRLKLSANPNDPKVKNALAELRTQLADNLRTSFNAEGDILTARSTLQVDSSVFLDMTRSLELGSKMAVSSAKVLFLIDEYYGVGTKLDPSQPLVTEIDYSHDKSSMSDRSSSVSSSRSAASSSASAAKGSFAAASSDKSAFAASSAASSAGRDRASFSGSDKASFSGSDRGAAAMQDGYGGSAAAARNVQASGSRDTQVAGARDTQFAAAQKSSAAGSSSSQAAVSASHSSASAAKSSSAASYAEKNNDVQRQNDVVNLKVKQVFAGIDNAKPADLEASLINQKLQQVVGEFDLAVTDERDFRVENGRRLTVSDITRMQKFDSYLKKASSGSYKAKYLVYGQAVMQSEGSSPSGEVLCSGQLALSSADVDTGDSFAKGTIGKRASGSSDQNCRANLADALARSLAETIGTKARRDLQQASAQGSPYVVSVYSAQRIPGKLRRDFEARIKEMTGVVEFGEGDNASAELYSWKVTAKGNFGTQVNDLVDEYIEADNSAFRGGRYERRGNRLLFCLDGKCPEQI